MIFTETLQCCCERPKCVYGNKTLATSCHIHAAPGMLLLQPADAHRLQWNCSTSKLWTGSISVVIPMQRVMYVANSDTGHSRCSCHHPCSSASRHRTVRPNLQSLELTHANDSATSVLITRALYECPVSNSTYAYVQLTPTLHIDQQHSQLATVVS